MKIEPNYPGEVIVLVKNKGQFYWYVSDKELWILDWLKLNCAFERYRDFSEVHCEGERKGFEILDENNIDAFLSVIKDYQVDYHELKEFCDLHNSVYPEYQEEKAEPAFYIDFDEKCFYSYFSEPGSYEYYVPNGWQGFLLNDFPQNILDKAKG